MSGNFHYRDTVLGVLGGMGPAASVQFVKTIYELCGETDEFSMPRIWLVSEPDIPDRTRSIKDSDTGPLESRLCSLLENLAPGVDRLFICCFTAHAVANKLPEHVRAKLLDLVSYSDRLLRQLDEKTLFIATEGVHDIGLFPLAQYRNVVTLGPEDRKKVHRLIYTHLKKGQDYGVVEKQLSELMMAYGCSQIFGGCTEMHLMKMWDGLTLRILDPLYEIALNFAGRSS